ncbi:eCIS core domain-containing protein [Iningainema tapete]|uniref:DUF4157 domain-containing protein n=1 Tax=Iningainema tapete BLCC-T55 TaxID=2748662 RepID=A0A8J6XN17_9CYAN|nr:DUF4157 domain-containing protein [Iningainema tapete]MBD2773377.1 DUF4157 domain-containing protein [Iningainema tapete BLCC-T55]
MTRQSATQTKQQSPTASVLSSGILQRKCTACGQKTVAGGECAQCQKKKSLLQRRASSQSEVSEVPPMVHEVLRSSGQSLDVGTRTIMEPRFGHDFSSVRVHSEVSRAAPMQVKAAFKTIAGLSLTETDLLGGSQEGNGTTLPYQEANELLECIRIMGADNAAFCRDAVSQLPPNTLTRSAIVILENGITSPTFNPCGQFTWDVGWNTTGRNGFIVQEINNVYNTQNCNGTPNNTVRATPRYWEAWLVDGSGTVTPNVGSTNDIWRRPNRPNTRGNWSMTANVYWANSLDPAAHFSGGNVADAGILLSTTTRPTNLASSLLTRKAGGTWDCCNGKNAHTPA